MCKPATALLHGVGSHLDKSPELLFRLRGVDEAETIAAGMALPRGTAAADALAMAISGESSVSISIRSGACQRRARGSQRRMPHTSRRVGPRKKTRTAGSSNPGATGVHIAALCERCGFSVAEFAALLRVSGAPCGAGRPGRDGSTCAPARARL